MYENDAVKPMSARTEEIARMCSLKSCIRIVVKNSKSNILDLELPVNLRTGSCHDG